MYSMTFLWPCGRFTGPELVLHTREPFFPGISLLPFHVPVKRRLSLTEGVWLGWSKHGHLNLGERL